MPCESRHVPYVVIISTIGVAQHHLAHIFNDASASSSTHDSVSDVNMPCGNIIKQLQRMHVNPFTPSIFGEGDLKLVKTFGVDDRLRFKSGRVCKEESEPLVGESDDRKKPSIFFCPTDVASRPAKES